MSVKQSIREPILFIRVLFGNYVEYTMYTLQHNQKYLGSLIWETYSASCLILRLSYLLLYVIIYKFK